MLFQSNQNLSVKFFLILASSLFYLLPVELCAQISTDQQMYEEQYSTYKFTTIQNRRFKHSVVETYVKELENVKNFRIVDSTQSVQGRSIYHVEWGNGPIDILLWTQMHGDEPTATMSMLDFINYLKDPIFDDIFKSRLLNEVTLHIIPLLNPDGAEKYQRETALGVDMNRDALRLSHPESRFLKKIRDETNAEWGFNLHDQSIYYSAGMNNQSARFSLLAPAYDYDKSINPIREDAMQLIGSINHYLQQIIPNHVGRWNDDFEPRAFGDNIQKWGTRTVLIESGGTLNDPEKEDNRKIHFGLYRLCFKAIMDKSYEEFSIENCQNLPFNNRRMFDLKITHLNVRMYDESFDLDIGIKRKEINETSTGGYYLVSYIDEIGDLSTKTAYHNFDATGYEINSDIKTLSIKSLETLENKRKLEQCLKDGIAIFEFDGIVEKSFLNYKPYKLINKGEIFKNHPINKSKNPTFYLEKEGVKKYLVINGQLIKL